MENLLTENQKQVILEEVNRIAEETDMLRNNVVKVDVGYDEVMLSQDGKMDKIFTLMFYNKSGGRRGFALLREIRILSAEVHRGNLIWVSSNRDYAGIMKGMIKLKNVLGEPGRDCKGTLFTLVDNG